MQRSGSQIGISGAIVRRSTLAVPVGNMPSGGIALTGSRSPSPASMRAVTRWTKSVLPAGTTGRRRRPESAAAPTGTACRLASVVSTAATLRSTITAPRLP
jgi:hypothetical protein